MTSTDQIHIEPPEITAAWKSLHEALQKAQRILLSTHENPDGDGIGSQLAFCEHLKSIGKECRILNCSELPSIYEFLDRQDWIELYDHDKDESWLSQCDLAIVFDLGDFHRLRAVGEDLLHHKVTLASIDHHPQSGFEELGGKLPYQYLLLDYSAPSTGTLVWEYFSDYRKESLSQSIAEALYTALVTDTGSFRYDNTGERAHLMAIDLIRQGVKPYEIGRRVYEQRERSQVRLLGVLTDNLHYSDDGRIAWCALTQELLTIAQATRKDIDGFSDFIRTIKGVEVAMLMTELEGGGTKVNFRSKGTIAINDIAGRLGGGGHAFASGALVEESWQEVVALVLPLLEKKTKGLDQDKEDFISGG
ncbi:bifunctional oligoribonuclease/PAP phosphatase NrnA [Candidatus Neomarinimicrobiota bacterium]